MQSAMRQVKQRYYRTRDRLARLLEFRSRSPRVCKNVMFWALARGYPCEIVRDHVTVQRQLPQTDEAEIDPYLARFRQQFLAPKYLACVPNAQLVGWRGLTRLADGRFASEVFYGNLDLMRQERGFSARPQGRIETLQSPCFFLTSHWWKNYGHWYRDVLRQLYGVLPRLPEDVRFVVPSKLAAYQRETISALGIAQERLIPIEYDQIYAVPQLYFTPHTEDPTAGWRWLRDKLLAYFGIQPTRGTRRLYISRRSGSSRRVINEDEVLVCLERFGFETILPETMSLGEQVQVFAQAEIVVGSHGAGLTNLLFAPSGTLLVDIMTPSFVDPFHWLLCDALGHPYYYFFGETVPDDAGIGGKKSNVQVPIPKLEDALRRFGLHHDARGIGQSHPPPQRQ